MIRTSTTVFASIATNTSSAPSYVQVLACCAVCTDSACSSSRVLTSVARIATIGAHLSGIGASNTTGTCRHPSVRSESTCSTTGACSSTIPSTEFARSAQFTTIGTFSVIAVLTWLTVNTLTAIRRCILTSGAFLTNRCT